MIPYLELYIGGYLSYMNVCPHKYFMDALFEKYDYVE